MPPVADIRNHNELVLKTLQQGDAIEFKRIPLYSHWGLYVGEDKVIHLTGCGDRLKFGSRIAFTIGGQKYSKACVKMENFFDVVGDSKAYKNNDKDSRFSPKSVDEIIEKAKSMIGEIEYNLMWSNCEHFVTYCRYGVMQSEQADFGMFGALVIGAVVLVVALLFGRRNESQRGNN